MLRSVIWQTWAKQPLTPKGCAMKTSKVLVLAAVFSFAVASAWITGAQPAGAQPTATTPTPGGKSTTKKTYNSGQSTTGYTHATPVNKNGYPTDGSGWNCCNNYPNGGVPGIQQGGGSKK